MCEKKRNYSILKIEVGIFLMLCTLASCKQADQKNTWMDDYVHFYRSISDSIASYPLNVRRLVSQKMGGVTDSLEWYFYHSITLKTFLYSSQTDSIFHFIPRVKSFCARQMPSPLIADLKSEYMNLQGNVYGRMGEMDSAAYYFEQSYKERMQGINKDIIPDIIINLADAFSRQGKYDVSAYWYRRALEVSDSLDLTASKRPPIYYGLAQVYTSLRDFRQCDYYYNLSAAYYDRMLPYERAVYLNNRGSSYYYRGDYAVALSYFNKILKLASSHSDMIFEKNLSMLNMGDVFLQLNKPDSASKYIRSCLPFFEKIKSYNAIYYIDTQKLALALKNNDLRTARKLVSDMKENRKAEPEMLFIRNRYLQEYYEKTSNYKDAFLYQKENIHLSDSIRNAQVRMRAADMALRYQRDSTLLSKNVLIEHQKNEVLELHQARIAWLILSVFGILLTGFIFFYGKKRRALLLARSQQAISSLRLENVRNRLSPHFIFNVLNKELSGRNGGQDENLYSLIKLMRQNLELVDNMCVTLAQELEFVRLYISLEASSLGEDFLWNLSVDKDLDPSEISLPSMLIQIPVENALKHALRGKDGDKRLWIDVYSTDNGYCIKIRDNGGGFKLQSDNKGTGTGMKVILQTIQILNAKNENKIRTAVRNVQLTDNGTGCEVIFELPYKYNYQIYNPYIRK